MKLVRTLSMAALLLSAGLWLHASQAAAQSKRAAQPQARQNAGSKIPQAKSKAEYDAYQAAISLNDAAKLEEAASTFAQRYPASQLRPYLFQRVMGLYEQTGNPGKTLEMARAVLKYDPANALALLSAAQVLAERTHDDDLDRNERLQEAATDAQAALQHASELLRPATMSDGEFTEAQARLRRSAHEVLATVAYKRHDYQQTIAEYNTAIESDTEPVEAVIWLRMAAAYDKLDQFSQGIGASDKAIAASEPGSPVRELAEKENRRLKARASTALQSSKNSSQESNTPVRSE